MRLRRLLLCLAVILAAIGGADYLHRSRDQAVVVITSTPVPAHTALTAGMLTLRRVNREAMEVGCL